MAKGLDILFDILLEIFDFSNRSNMGSGQRSVLYKVEKNQPKAKYGTPEYFQTNKKRLSFKFQLLTLSHIYYIDDYKITLNESYELKKHFKEFKHLLDKDDLKEIKGYFKKNITLAKLVDFYRENRLDHFEVEKSLRLAAIVTGKDPKYHEPIKSIHTRFLSESEY